MQGARADQPKNKKAAALALVGQSATLNANRAIIAIFAPTNKRVYNRKLSERPNCNRQSYFVSSKRIFLPSKTLTFMQSLFFFFHQFASLQSNIFARNICKQRRLPLVRPIIVSFEQLFHPSRRSLFAAAIHKLRTANLRVDSSPTQFIIDGASLDAHSINLLACASSSRRSSSTTSAKCAVYLRSLACHILRACAHAVGRRA